jgi:hypothetical protein
MASPQASPLPGGSVAAALVEKAREIFVLQYQPARYPTLNFDEARWDLRPVDGTSEEREIRTVPFTTYGSRDEALPPGFALVVKAWIVLADFGPKTAGRYANATRYLWEAIADRLRGETFAWEDVRSDDFDAAEALAGSAGTKSAQHTKSNIAHALKYLARYLEADGICPGLDWTPATKKSNPGQHTTEAGRRNRLDRMPTRRAIEGLAEIYRLHAKGPRERLLICAVGLLLVGGFRVSEVVTLPVDCLGYEQHRGRDRCFIRYWNRKTRRSSAQWGKRWLSPLGAELAKELITELRHLTESAREQARRLERSPEEVHVPGGLPKQVTMHDLARLYGMTKDGLLSTMAHNPERFWFYSPVGKGGVLRFSREDIERLLREECGPLASYDFGNGQRQFLSDTLLIFYRGFFNTQRDITSPVFVDAVQDRHVQRFLHGALHSGKNKIPIPSVFARFGITEPHGGDVQMRPHMARHWLNTVANKAGMTAFQITLWMQRGSVAQTLLYLHSSSDIADLTREGVETGHVLGKVADDYNALPAERRAAFLESIEVGHKVRTGFCHANTLRDECEPKKICPICPHWARLRYSSSERAALFEKRKAAQLAIDGFAAVERGGCRLHPRQKQLMVEMIEVIDLSLACDGKAPGAA